MKILTFLFSISIVLVGCYYYEADGSNQTAKDSRGFGYGKPDETDNLKQNDLVKWAGTWEMGNELGTGLSSTLVMDNEKPGLINFSLSATFLSTFQGDEGELVDKAHFGELEGIAIINSKNEAFYESDEFPDYKLVFTFVNDHLLKVEEINASTSKEFGITPMAGYNVRFAGNYKKAS